jgi:hypothetical protein
MQPEQNDFQPALRRRPNFNGLRCVTVDLALKDMLNWEQRPAEERLASGRPTDDSSFGLQRLKLDQSMTLANAGPAFPDINPQPSLSSRYKPEELTCG